MNSREAETLPPPSRDNLAARLDETAAALEHARRKRDEVECEHNTLMNLVVIMRGLHETLDPDVVSEVVRDVIVNLVGCEEVAFYAPASDVEGTLARRWEVGGVGPERIASSSDLGHLLTSPTPHVIHRESIATRPRDQPSAVIPMWVEGHHMGSIVLFGLLPQRPRYERLDREIFDVLSVHGAIALYSAALHGRFSARAPDAGRP